MKPAMCGETELILPDVNCDCEDMGERISDLEERADATDEKLSTIDECCETVQGTLLEHSQNITNVADGVTQIQDEVSDLNERIESLSGLKTVKVNSLPAVGETNTIYLVEDANGKTVMWMYIDGQWTSVGETSIDLSDYATTQYVDNELLKKSNNPAIGEVVITSDNTPPQYPGEWELIYKEFATKTITDELITWSNKVTGVDSVIMRKGTNIYLRLRFTSKVDFRGDDSLEVCTITFDTLGLINTYNSWVTGFSDGDNAVGMFAITADTVAKTITVKKEDAVTHENAYKGNTWVVQIPLLFSVSQMKDSECNRFYWERKA